MEINEVVLGVIACLENNEIRNEILKDYELKVQKLKNYDAYLNCEDFKKKIINDLNFNNCLKFLIKKLNDFKFRKYVEINNICVIVFYKKENNSKNTIANSFNISSLKGIIVKHEIIETKLIVYVNPVKTFRDRILACKSELLEAFNNKGFDVDTLDVKYIYKDSVIDELGETFLELGYNIQK